VENQKQVSPASHSPLEISHKPRDFHIPTAAADRDGKVENQKQVSHFSTRRSAMTTPVCFSLNFPELTITTERRTPAERARHWLDTAISGSRRIGIKCRFQAHRALESNFDFRLISGLENAAVQFDTEAANHES